jgi:hypothetical protein
METRKMTITEDLPSGVAGPTAIPAEDQPEMARGEKMAWLAITGMAIAYGGYFVAIAIDQRTGTAGFLRLFVLLGIASLVRALIEGVGNAVLAARARADGQSKPDERDRAISRRGAAAAYYVLMVGTIIVGMFMPFTNSGWEIVNTTLFALAISEFVRYGLVVQSYRRGWHG